MDIRSLRYYTQDGDFDQVFYLLRNNNFGDVEVPDLENNTLLHLSSANNHCQIVETLIKYGANIDTRNSLGWTPLMQAARQGHCQVVKILLQGGADFRSRDRLGMSALMLAYASGDIETVRAIIDAGEMINEEQDFKNSSICNLIIAALYGNNSIVRHLLDKGMNANITTKTGITPLMCAAYGGSLKTVEILLERGAKHDVLNVADYSAGDISLIYGKHDINEKLKIAKSSPQKNPDKPLRDIMDAIQQGNILAVQDILCNDPAKVETVTHEGATPLMVAAMLGNVKIAQLLVQYGANLNAQDYANGWTPLMQAIYHRKSEMAKFLILERADVNVASTKGYTAFDLANETLEYEVLQMFAKIQSDYLHGTEYNQNATSPTVQYMKQFWSKITERPEVTVRRNSSEQRSSYNTVPYVAAVPEPIMPGLSSNSKEIDSRNYFEELNDMQNKTYNLMEPPNIATLQHDIPDGSTTELGNGFTFNNLLKKCDKSIEKKQNLAVLHEVVVTNHLTEKPDIKITIEPFDKISSSRYSFSNNEVTFDFLSENLIDEIKNTIGPNKFRGLLKKLKIEQYVDTIEEQEIDFDAFLLLTRSDLIGLGIVAPNKLRKIMSSINKIKELRK